jgi:hypothetical protein
MGHLAKVYVLKAGLWLGSRYHTWVYSLIPRCQMLYPGLKFCTRKWSFLHLWPGHEISDPGTKPQTSSMKLPTWVQTLLRESRRVRGHRLLHNRFCEHIYSVMLNLESCKLTNNLGMLPWRRGIVVIAAAYRTEDPGFEFHQGVRFLGVYTLQCCCHNLVCIDIVLTWKKIND